jgi:hypothetical protein
VSREGIVRVAFGTGDEASAPEALRRFVEEIVHELTGREIVWVRPPWIALDVQPDSDPKVCEFVAHFEVPERQP